MGIHTYMGMHTWAYIHRHTYIHTYTHTYIHAYIEKGHPGDSVKVWAHQLNFSTPATAEGQGLAQAPNDEYRNHPTRVEIQVPIKGGKGRTHTHTLSRPSPPAHGIPSPQSRDCGGQRGPWTARTHRYMICCYCNQLVCLFVFARLANALPFLSSHSPPEMS